jgi:hypothetical protein
MTQVRERLDIPLYVSLRLEDGNNKELRNIGNTAGIYVYTVPSTRNMIHSIINETPLSNIRLQ